jgi:hypothetical protein
MKALLNRSQGTVLTALTYSDSINGSIGGFRMATEISPQQESCCTIRAVPFHAVFCEVYLIGELGGEF